jgi:tRNA A37 threonylcarbamoyltransferase TsaD
MSYMQNDQQENNDKHEINILNIQQVQVSFVGLKTEINKLCKSGEYDVDSFQKVLINLSVIQKAIDSLDKCQNALIDFVKKNNAQSSQKNVFDPNNFNNTQINQQVTEMD